MRSIRPFIDPKNRGLVLDCLKATADGPYFEDWEFYTLMGCDRDEMRAFIDMEKCSVLTTANYPIIGNALNNLMNVVTTDEEWHRIGYTRALVEAAWNALRKQATDYGIVMSSRTIGPKRERWTGRRR